MTTHQHPLRLAKAFSLLVSIGAALLFASASCSGQSSDPEGSRAGLLAAEPELPALPQRPPVKLHTAEPLQTTWPPKGKPVTVKITRDTWISQMGQEATGNMGGSSQLKLKGQQEYSIFDVDVSQLKGKIITGGLWHVHSATPKDAPMLRVTVSTLASDWVEGTSQSYKPQQGSACYKQAALGRSDWTYPGSSFIDAAYGRSHTIWRFAEATAPDADGWQRIAVDADVIAARVAGLSHGFAVYDDVGNVWSYKDNKFEFTYHPNRFIHSREQSGFAHYLQVWVDGEDSQPPGPVTGIKVNTADFPAGEALVRWTTPADRGGGKTLGFNVTYKAGDEQKQMPRYLIPMAGWAGKEVRMHIRDLPFKPGEKIELSIRPVDSAGNVGEPFTGTIKLSATPRAFPIAPAEIKPFAPSEMLPEVGGLKIAVIDLLDKITTTGKMIPPHPKGYAGGNHIWSGAKKLVRLQAARNEHVCFQVNLTGKADAAKLALAFPEDAGVKTKLYALDYVRTPAGAVPDVAVPLEGAVSIPPKADPEAATTGNLSVLCEVYVPHEAPAGRKTGKLTVSTGGKTLQIAVDLTVWDFTLPNKLSFVPEMNCYGTVTPTAGIDYYRLAHEHRCCLNRLYYSWNGGVSLAPRRVGEGWDWSGWDRDVGPLLDGSAFAQMPRKGEPVDSFYLPFNEHWPMDVFANYRKNYWADEAFTEAYAGGMKRAFADFAEHFDQKGWHDTAFQFYLNNKVYYKRQAGWRGSVAPWIFDEPVGTQDFWAIRWYGILFHQAVDPVKGKAKMWYRTDISRSNFGRDMLWGVQEVVYFGGSNAQKVRMKHDEQVLWGPSYFCEYGSANHPKDANTQPAAWCLLAWSRGAIGVLPWQTIAKGGAWGTAEGTDVFFARGGKVFASVRLKAFRRGQQDVEYLTLLGDVYDQPHFALAGGANQIVNLGGRVQKTWSEDAGTLRFDRADATGLWTLRCRAGGMLSAKRPAYKRVVRELPSPPRDMMVLPDIGYVRVAPKVPSSKPE
jgi:hypothetical protein